MKFTGQILKMKTFNAQPIQYYMNLETDLINLNQVFGKTLKWKHIGYQCVECGSDEKIFRMGF